MKFSFNMSVSEAVYRAIAKLGYAVWSFCIARASALEQARMDAKFTGRLVRVTCGKKHYGRVLNGPYLVSKYDGDAGDLRLVLPADPKEVTWALPECCEVVS